LIMQTLQAKSDNGLVASVQLIGVDDESLIGLPKTLLRGSYKDLNTPESVVISTLNRDRFGNPDMGSTFELNNRRARVVGVVTTSKSFTPFPIVYTTYSKSLLYIPPQEKYLSYILAAPQSGYSVADIKRRIKAETGLNAYDQMEFFWMNMMYWIQSTSVPINFGITILLGTLVGAAIAGQTLYTFMIENSRQFGTFKAIGIQNPTLVKMVLLQSTSVGLIGYGIGVGIMSFLGLVNPPNGQLAYYTPWQILLISFVLVIGFCILASLISVQRVIKLDPALVFRG